MPCYKPLSAYQSLHEDARGKREVVFGNCVDSKGRACAPILLPCGQCIGCRLERSRQWAVRIMHEASLHERNCFLTLTFNDEHVPSDYSLNVGTFQKFMKRYRKLCGPVRFFHCGEYGELNFRPHYHAIIFGHDFPDKIQSNVSANNPLFVSPTLNRLWPFGFASIGDVTFESAAYVARYITKKVTGDLAESHYQRVIEATGEIVNVAPEYTTMSRRPGIGAGWFDKFGGEVYPLDRVVMRGREMRPPRAYDQYLEARDIEIFKALKDKRKELRELSFISDDEYVQSLRRLPAREEFARLRQKTFSDRNKEF